TWDNVVAACAPCNHRKSDRMLAELGWRLPRPPSSARATACSPSSAGGCRAPREPLRAGNCVDSAGSAAPTPPKKRGCPAATTSGRCTADRPRDRDAGAPADDARSPGPRAPPVLSGWDGSHLVTACGDAQGAIGLV